MTTPIPDESLDALATNLRGMDTVTAGGVTVGLLAVVEELRQAREALRGLLSHPATYCWECDPTRRAARACLPESQ